MSEFKGFRIAIPCIERQAWLFSVTLHGVIVTAVAIGLSRDLMVDTREPFRLDVTVVEKDERASTAAETVVADSASQNPPHYEQSNRARVLHETSINKKGGTSGGRQGRVPVERVQVIEKHIVESEPIDRAVAQSIEKTSGHREVPRPEQKHAVMQQSKDTPSDVANSGPANVGVSQVIVDETPTVEKTSTTTEMGSRSMQDAVKSIAASEVSSDSADSEKSVVQTAGNFEGPSPASETTDAHSRSVPEVHPDDLETVKAAAQNVPITAEFPSQVSAMGTQESPPTADINAYASVGGKHVPEPAAGIAENSSHPAGPSPSQQGSPSSMHVGQKESSPPIAASTGKPGKGTGPDYGWLKRLLWARINRIKQYSDEALHHEWEGRVVIVVTVRSDGRIDEVTVAESSGNRSLDREAAALVARASPLDLDRALGAARVKFRVPISFGLE